MSKLPFTIFQYSSHIEFLQDAYASLHSKDETFSYDKIAIECGLKSRTEARNIFKGIKKPSESILNSLAAYFGLDGDEIKYLICLYRFQEAGGNAVAFEIFQKLITFQTQKYPISNPFHEIEIATSVLHMTLLSLMELENIPHESHSLSTILKGRYAIQEIDVALLELEKHGFTKRNLVSGRYDLCQRHIKKYDYNSNFFLKRYHHQCLEVAKSSLENEMPSDRYLVGASFAINSKIFPRIVQKMNAFVENLMQLEGVAGSPDTVVQINQQLIKMTMGEESNERVRGREPTERVLEQTLNEVIV